MLVLLEEVTDEVTIPMALLHTCISMGIVFAMLIAISFIIFLLKFVPALLSPRPVKVERPVAPKTKATRQEDTPIRAAALGNDGAGDQQLIAVLAAAVAACMTEETGVPVAPDGLVIRSVKRR